MPRLSEFIRGDNELVEPQEDLVTPAITPAGEGTTSVAEKPKGLFILPKKGPSMRYSALLSMQQVPTPFQKESLSEFEKILGIDETTKANAKVLGDRGALEAAQDAAADLLKNTVTHLGSFVREISKTFALGDKEAAKKEAISSLLLSVNSPVLEKTKVRDAMARLTLNQGELPKVLIEEGFKLPTGLFTGPRQGLRELGAPALKQVNREELQQEIDKDIQLVRDYYYMQMIKSYRKTTIGGKISAGAVEMSEFALAFLATNGAAVLARGTAVKGIGLLVKRDMELFLGKVLGKTVVLGASGLARAAITAPVFVARDFVQREIDNFDLILSPKGLQIAEGKQSRLMMATKAFGASWIQFFGEEALGKVFGAGRRAAGKIVNKIIPIPKKVPKWFPKGLVTSFQKLYKKLHPNLKAKTLWTKIGFDGLVDEVGEEQLTDFFLAALGVENFGVGNDASNLDAMFAALHSSEQILVNAGIIMFPTLGRMTTSAIINRIEENKKASGFKEPPETRELSDKEIDAIVEKIGVAKEVAPEGEVVKEKPKEKVEEEVAPKGEVVEGKVKEKAVEDITELSVEELENRIDEARSAERNLLIELFGAEGAKRYRRLEARANSSFASFEATDKASDELGEMEDALTEAQQDRLFGVGEVGPTIEDLQEIRNAREDVLGISEGFDLGTLSDAELNKVFADLTDEVGRGLKEMRGVFEPSEFETRQQVGFARIKEALAQGKRFGVDTTDMLKKGVRTIEDPGLREIALDLFKSLVKKKDPKDVKLKSEKKKTSVADTLIKKGRAKRLKEEAAQSEKEAATIEKERAQKAKELATKSKKLGKLAKQKLEVSKTQATNAQKKAVAASNVVQNLETRLKTEINKSGATSEKSLRIKEQLAGAKKRAVVAKEKADDLREKFLQDEADLLEQEQAITTETDAILALQDKIQVLQQKAVDKLRERDQIEAGLIIAELQDEILTSPVKILSAIAQQVRGARSMTKKEAQQVQKELRQFLQQAGLTKAEKGGFLTEISKAVTQQQLEILLPKMQAKIEKIIEARQRQKHLDYITNTLKKIKPKLVGKKKVGRFNADVQETLDIISKVVGITRINADAQIEANQIKIDNPNTPVQESIMLEVANGYLRGASDLKTRSFAEIQDLALRIAQLVAAGRNARKARLELLKKERQERKDKVFNLIQGNNPDTPSLTQKERNRRQSIRSMLSGGWTTIAWQDMMNVLAIDSKGKVDPLFGSELAQLLDVHDVTRNKEQIIYDKNQEVMKLGFKAYGLSKQSKFLDLVHNLSIREDLEGTYLDTAGNEIKLHLSRMDAISIYMQFKDPKLKENLMSEKGAYMMGTTRIQGMPQDMYNAIEATLRTEDIVFAESLFPFYEKFYTKDINPVYREDNGVNLTKIVNYSPTSGIPNQQDVTASFFEQQGFRSGITASSFKERSTHFRTIRIKGAMDILQDHLQEMGHYLAWSKKLKELNSVFGDSKIRSLIEAKFGKDVLDIIDKALKDFKDDGKLQMTLNERRLTQFRNNFTTSVLGIKLVSQPIKQMSSMFAFWEFIPAGKFFPSLADWANFNKAKLMYDILQQGGAFLPVRGDNMTRELRSIAANRRFNKFRKFGKFKDMLMWSTRLGDKGAIQFGGWGVYKYHYEQATGKPFDFNMSLQDIITSAAHKKAFSAFTRASSKTQQSGDTDQQGDWQRGGAWAKTFTQFASSPLGYMRREIEALRSAFGTKEATLAFLKGEGKITRQQFAKSIAIYHHIIPSMFLFIASGLDWDWEEQTLVMTLGSLSEWVIIGDIVETVARHGMKELVEDSTLNVWDLELNPIFELPKDIIRAVSRIKWGDVEMEDIVNHVRNIAAVGIGPLSGLPLKQIFDGMEGIGDIIDEEKYTLGGWKKVGGWTPYIIEKNLEKEARKKWRSKLALPELGPGDPGF
ncbi:hypothetical protein IID22_02270 [Patescibacteria group bacterium]|nr:hypothetical protein [Patescibacteria group bacterium]